MTVNPNDSDSDDAKPPRVDSAGGLLPDRIEIDVHDPTLADEFDEADFDHDFDDDFEEEIDGEYELEDDQYGEDFRKEFGHLTDDDDAEIDEDAVDVDDD